jgi:glycosyltransferase 2 family protein
VSLFSLAWLAGLVIPGAPGGLGVFEAIAVTLLQDALSAGIILSAVALYRLVGTSAEALGAGLAVLGQRLASPPPAA